MVTKHFVGRDCELSSTGVDARGEAIHPWDVTRAVLSHIGAAFEESGRKAWSRNDRHAQWRCQLL